jgi:hypothetical protein
MTELLTESEKSTKKEAVMKRLCPHCGTTKSGRRSRIRWFDLPLLLLTVRPVRCLDCYGRYYRFIRAQRTKNA